jgi:hypothetical protein
VGLMLKLLDIELNLNEIGCEDVDWFHLTQDSDQWLAFCEHGNEPSSSIKCAEFFD